MFFFSLILSCVIILFKVMVSFVRTKDVNANDQSWPLYPKGMFRYDRRLEEKTFALARDQTLVIRYVVSTDWRSYPPSWYLFISATWIFISRCLKRFHLQFALQNLLPLLYQCAAVVSMAVVRGGWGLFLLLLLQVQYCLWLWQHSEVAPNSHWDL